MMAWPARRPGLALAMAGLLTLVAVAGITRVEPEVDFVDTVPHHDGLDAYRALLQDLDGVRFVAIYMGSAGGDLREPATFDTLIEEQASLESFLQERFPGAFSHSLSALEGIRTGHYMLEKVATAGNPREEAYSVPEDPIRYQVVRDQALGDDTLDDVLATDGSSALMLFFFQTNDNLEARHLTGAIAEALPLWGKQQITEAPRASGLLYASHYTDDRNGHDLRTWGLLAAGGVALALLWVVRRPSNVALAVTGMGLATVWTFGLTGWLGIRVSFLTLFLVPVVTGIGIDAAIHVLRRVEEQQTSSRAAVAHALATTGRSAWVASLTTAAGLVVLLLVPNPLFSQIGGLAAVGILLAFTSMWLFVAPARTWMRAPRGLTGQRPALARWAVRARRRPWIPLGLVALITVGAVTAASQTRIESGSAENEFPQDDPVIALQQRIEAEYGAFQRGYLIVRGDVADPVVLEALLEAKYAAATLPLFREATSVTDLLLADEATDQGVADIALHSILAPTPAAPSEPSRLPQTHAEARERLDALFQDPLWGSLAPFTITRDYDLAILSVTVQPWQDQQELRDLRDALDELAASIDARLPDHQVVAAGAPVNRAAIIDQTPSNVLLATVGSALVVALILGFWQRDWRLAAGGMGMVLLASLWLLAAIPLLDGAYEAFGTANNAALNDMFLLAFAITVAAGVDDLVHLAGRHRESQAADPVADAFMHAGGSITGTTATSLVAFLVLGGVYFLQSKNLAILTALGVLFVYLLTLAMAPLLLRKPHARRRRA